MTSKISVLIPTYNRAHLIEETVDRALQSIGPADEVIVRDNASTDGSPEILRKISARDQRVRIELTSTNIGPVGNWRECLRLATGEHIKLLFSDDLMIPEAFRAFYRSYLQGGYEIGFSTALIGPNLNSSQLEFVVGQTDLDMPSSSFRRLMLSRLGSVPVSPSAFVFKKALIERCFEQSEADLRDRPDAFATGAGIDLLIVTWAVEFAGRVHFRPDPTVFFRQHAGSISTERAAVVKQLYNLSRVRFARTCRGPSLAFGLMVSYAAADATRCIGRSLRRLFVQMHTEDAGSRT